MKFLQGLHTLVIGLGDSGLAMARWCVRHGARVTVWDSRMLPPHAATLAEDLPGATLLGSALDESLLPSLDLVLKSPGLPPHDARIAGFVAAARARGLAVLGELDLFTRALAELKADEGYAPKRIAITGTNGKTTTTAMTALLVERAGHRVAMAGNVGPTLLDTLARALDGAASERPDVWVLELSSFQLHDAAPLEADAAAVLNLTQDHLDWHGDRAAYAAAKQRIFGGAGARGVLVVNRDDERVEALLPATSAPPAKGARGKPPPPREVIRFGLGPPQRPGDFGIVEDHGMAWLARALPVDATLKKRDEDHELHLQRLMPADALLVRGRHNAANALAALALATAIGCPLAPMLHGLREYRGEPHRVQWVGGVGDVDAFDDSKGTNVGATVAALDGLGADRAPAKLVLILGGDGKGQDFSPLAEPLRRHARAVALIGRHPETVPALDAVVREAGVAAQRHETLEQAVAWCFAQAAPGDAVLLSPACASLDMFRNYEHRADVFVDAVRALALEPGVAA
jgi:UDP-N-acetylmuramoylalanine--D-glutamate ligase